jgi:hypothetical protein
MIRAMSFLLPGFAARLADPTIRTVLLCGCGGGFDFVHAVALYPELRRLGKKVVIGSYSFGQPREIGNADTVFERDDALVKRVTAKSVAAPHYGPEVHVCSFLDASFPGDAPHAVYAYYARAFCAPVLRDLYSGWVREHAIDAVVVVDGGSDSLMVGDEEGLGDPIEDAVSLAAISSLEGPETKILVSVGLGSDRFNQVSDAASLRAIAELTRAGGFLGAVSLEPGSAGFELYRSCVAHIEARQTFRSVLAANIVAAGSGQYGPSGVPGRARAPSVFLWPLMSMLWAFDVMKVAERSRIVSWIRDCPTVFACHEALEKGRRDLGASRRGVENLPVHADWRGKP